MRFLKKFTNNVHSFGKKIISGANTWGKKWVQNNSGLLHSGAQLLREQVEAHAAANGKQYGSKVLDGLVNHTKTLNDIAPMLSDKGAIHREVAKRVLYDTPSTKAFV